MIQVDTDFPSSSFRFRVHGELHQSVDLRDASDVLAHLSIEVGRREIRAPFDADVAREVSAALRQQGLDVDGSSAAREMYGYLAEREEALLRQTSDEGSLDERFPEDLYPFQKIALRWALRHDCAGLLLDMGLGKTRVAIHAAEFRRSHALVLAPKSVLSSVWRDEVALWLGRSQGRDGEVGGVFLMTGTRRQKERALEQFWEWIQGYATSGFLVTNYETVLRFQRELAVLSGRVETLVLDESTFIKTPNAQRTQIIQKLSERFPYRMILTGQPMTQGVEDLFPQMRFLDVGLFGTRVSDFRDRYLVRQPVRMGSREFLVVTGYQNLAELSRKVFSVCIQLDKRLCLPDLPAKTYQVREIEMTTDQRRAYRDMREEFLAQVGDDVVEARGVLPQLGKLLQITSGFFYVEDPLDGARRAVRMDRSPKFEEVARIVREEAASRKVIVRCQFREEVDWLVEVLSEVLEDDDGQAHDGDTDLLPSVARVSGVRMDDRSHDSDDSDDTGGAGGVLPRVGVPGVGVPAVVSVDGRTSIVQRAEAIRCLQEEPRTRALVAQEATLAHGVTLHAADLTVYVNNAWSLQLRLQSEDRVHRIGQRSDNCLYIDLVCPNTIDVAVLAALRKKAELSGRVTRKTWERLLKGE